MPFPCSMARRRRSARSRAKARRVRRSATGSRTKSRAVSSPTSSVFVRSDAQMDRARTAVRAAGLAFQVLDERVETASGHVSISTMHLAKGLEFRAVVVMACDDEIIPLQERIETVGDDADLNVRCMSRNATCSTSPARGPGTYCLLGVSSRLGVCR